MRQQWLCASLGCDSVGDGCHQTSSNPGDSYKKQNTAETRSVLFILSSLTFSFRTNMNKARSQGAGARQEPIGTWSLWPAWHQVLATSFPLLVSSSCHGNLPHPMRNSTSTQRQKEKPFKVCIRSPANAQGIQPRNQFVTLYTECCNVIMLHTLSSTGGL